MNGIANHMRISMEIIQFVDVDAIAFIGDYIEQKALFVWAALNEKNVNFIVGEVAYARERSPDINALMNS